MHNEKAHTRDLQEEMLRLREHYEVIDGNLVRLIQERLELSLRMAYIKHMLNLPTEDATREAEIVKKVEKRVENPSLTGAVLSVFKSILVQSRLVQDEVRRNLNR
jgi:chorismate mutase